MHQDNIFLISARTIFIGLLIISIIPLFNINGLFVNMPVFEYKNIDFECDVLLESDLVTDLYYQDCLLDKDTLIKQYDEITLFIVGLQILMIIIPSMLFGFFLFFVHRIKLLYKTDWITAATKFKFGGVDPEHGRKIMGK